MLNTPKMTSTTIPIPINKLGEGWCLVGVINKKGSDSIHLYKDGLQIDWSYARIKRKLNIIHTILRIGGNTIKEGEYKKIANFTTHHIIHNYISSYKIIHKSKKHNDNDIVYFSDNMNSRLRDINLNKVIIYKRL